MEFNLLHIDPLGYLSALGKASDENVLMVEPKEFKIVYINRIDFNLRPDDVLGKKVFDFVHPEHIESYKNILNKVVKEKGKESLELEAVDKENSNKSVWFYCTISPVLNANEEVSNLIIISKDITNEKLHKRELDNKRENLYAIINNTNDLIISIDSELKIKECNATYTDVIYKYYKTKDIIGCCVLDFIAPNKHESLKSIYNRVLNGEVTSVQEDFSLSDGGTLFFETNYHPIRNYNQEITGISIFSRDITARKVDEIKLLKTLKERGTLLSEIHHRIKNNLALISSMLQLKEINIESVTAKEALNESRKRIKSTALVHEMLYKNDSFDNLKMMAFLNELFVNLVSEKDVVLEIEGDDHTFNLIGGLPFGLLMHELMMNSIKHSFKEGNGLGIIISAAKSNGVLRIIYSDREGSFPENIDFYDTSTTGLMLIHTFIEQLNGKITITSRNPPKYLIEIPYNE